MTITNSVAAVPDSGPWVHDTFMVSLGDDFKSYIEGLKYANADQLYNEGGSSIEPVTPADINTVLNDLGPEGSSKMTPLYYTKRKIRDTSLGGNPVINPLPQYNETDDPPADFVSREDGSTGMGRVYSSQIDDQQQVLYLQCGSVIFNTLAAFYTGAVDENTAVLNDKGITYATAYRIGSILGAGLSIVQIPTIALESLWRYASYKSAPITSYYDFKNEQLLYYQYANTMLVILTANMGWMESTTTQRDDGNVNDQEAQQQEKRTDEKIDKAEGNSNSIPGTPDYISHLQMDIGQILLKRMRFLYGSNNVKNISTVQHIHDLQAQVGMNDINNDGQADDRSGSTEQNSTDTTSFMDWKKHFVDGIKLGSDMGNYLMAQYIGFRLDSSVNVHESITNTVGESEVANTLNSKQQSMREKVYGTMGSVIRNIPAIGGALSSAVDAVSGTIGGILSHTGIEGLAQLATGSALISVPHIWKNSSFRRGYQFEVHLRSVAGDDLSILQDIYVPFCLLLAAAAPRAQGNASYTSPFLVKAYAKGLVSIPMGMITDMSINRGAPQHGWSKDMKPTEMKISFTIEDMTPEMFISMGSTGLNQKIRDVLLGTNNNFMNYLEMLSGIDIHSKLSWQSIQRRIEVFKNLNLTHGRFQAITMGMRVGSFPLMRVINSVVPSSWGKPSD